MVPDDLGSQYLLLAGLNVMTGVAWLLAAASALSGLREHGQRLDRYWFLAFLLLAVTAFGEAWFARQTAAEFDIGRVGSTTLIARIVFYRLRLIGLQMVGAFAVLIVFRSRR
jgi:hypothetical protein